MKARTCWGLMVLAASLCLLAPLTGCSTDNEEKPTVPSGLVRVVDEEDGSPVADIKVILMDPRFNMPVAGPFTSGADGLVHMGVLPVTDLSLMVFCGVGYQVHSLPGYGTWNQAAPQSVNGGNPPLSLMIPGPGSGLTPPDVLNDIQVRRTVVDSLPRIAGQVVDLYSGSSLNRVFVSLSPNLTGYQGETGPDDDVTGTDGMFSVSQIPFGKNPDTGNLIQISPLRFTRHGYRPVIWKYDPPNGSENVDISGVTIEMEWIGNDYFRGVITGVLTRDGLPAEGIVVGVGVLDQPTAGKAGPGLPGWVEETDEFGRFIFGQMPPGTYILQPGFALGDGVFFPPQAGNVPVKIEDGTVFDMGNLTILHEIEPCDPLHGKSLPAPPTSLSWTPVPGAATYEVRFDRGILPPTTTNSIDLPESLVITPGLHSWYVLAHNESDILIGVTQIQQVFRLLPPPD